MEALRQSGRDRYEIVDQIGQGSMGAVYLARDLESGDQVALKTLNESGSLDDEDLERLRRLFLNEASAASLLSHPGIVGLRDVLDEPGSPEVFLVMDYVAGSSLAELLARPDPLSFDFVVTVIGQIADVLDHVHRHGVVHRDIKPANILISADGVKVTDFGIAELRGEDLADDLQRAGSPNYMAPERVLGTGSDHRGDIWALGVVLYEMLTRRLPFQGESVAELVTRIAAEEPAPLDGHGIAAIPGLQPILDRALAKEPEERYSAAGELARDLQRVQVGQMQLSATLPAESIPEVAAGEEGAFDPAERTAEGSTAPLVDLVAALRRYRLPVILTIGFVVFVALSITVGLSDQDAPVAPPAASEDQSRRFEYLSLLERAKQKLELGENQAAAELFSQAEALAPDAGRIRALRDQARRQAELEIAAEVELEVAALIGIGEAELAEGRLANAENAALRALEVSPQNRAAHALVAAVEQARRAARSRAERARAVAPRPTLPPPAPEPVERLRVEDPIRPPASVPVPTYSDLKVDFYSALPRGVLTIYRAESQILRRPFRFVERKGFMRTRGVRGGFDEQVRVKAGPSELRIYLSLPGRQTQIHRLSGILPPGAIRALQVRVDEAGTLSVALH